MVSMVKCKECGKEISAAVEKCPHCGHRNQQLKLLVWIAVFVFLIFVGIPLLVSTSSKKISPAEQSTLSKNLPMPQCSLIDGYQIGMSIQSFKDSYPKNLPAPVCRTSSPKMVRCDGQMEINNVTTLVSFDFGYGSDYKDGTQFTFGNGKLFGVKGSFEIAELGVIEQAFLKKFGTPQTNKKDLTGYEAMSWNKDGNAINFSQIPDEEGYLFSIIPSEPKRLSACLASH